MVDGATRAVLVLGSSTGGIGAHVASLATGLPERDIEVTVVGPAAAQRQFNFTRAGARFVSLEIPAEPRLKDGRQLTALRALLRAERPDLVHAHGLRAGLFACLAAPRGAPVVVTWHNAVLSTGARRVAHGVIEGYVARSATVTLGASTDLVERARRLGAADARLGAVAAPPLPAPTRDPAAVRAEFGIPADGPLVLSVGRLHPQKGYRTLIAAAARWGLLRPRPSVLIAGDGPDHAALTAEIAASGAPVILAGHRGDVADLLNAADLAVVSSVWEARQLFAQEAMGTGVPLVATAVGGLPGLVGDAAVLVSPGDPDELDEAVRGMLTDPTRRAEYAARARRRAAQWPNETRTLNETAALYRELTGDLVAR